MKYFKELDSLPKYFNLLDDLDKLLNTVIDWKDNQICLNTKITDPDNYTLGTGSLVYDWDNKKITFDEKGNQKIEVPKFDVPLKEEDFTVLCRQFKNTSFEDAYNKLNSKYHLGRIRLMRSLPKTCLSWHVDDSPRIHYPIKTQEGCMMVIEDEVRHLSENKWWWTNTVLHHTAFNSSKDTRIHLVAVVLGEK